VRRLGPPARLTVASGSLARPLISAPASRGNGQKKSSDARLSAAIAK
jgi:hypothetical protein